MAWYHIDFYFKKQYKEDDYYINRREQVMFERCLADIISTIKEFIGKKFYLYEPNPHCFLAIEVKNEKMLRWIGNVVKDKIKDYDFIEKAYLNKKVQSDETNGEDFLLVLNAFTEAYLFHRKTRLTHIIHCAMEFMHQTREKELEFYNKMLTLYGSEEYR